MKIRILLTGLSENLSGALEMTLGDQDDIEVLDHVAGPLEALLASRREEPDVVILGLQNGKLPGIASHLLYERPHLTIFALSGDCRQVVLYRSHAQSFQLGELSPGGIGAAIRSAMRTDFL